MGAINIGVVGGGVIGSGVTHCFAKAGFSVNLIDKSPLLLDSAMQKIRAEARLSQLLDKEKNYTHRNYIETILYNTSIDTLNDVDVVIENVTENWEDKENVYRQLDSNCKPDCIFIVNTSIFPIKRIAAITKRPQQVIGVHFMNPVSLKPAVELIQCKETSRSTVDTVKQLLSDIGKTYISVSDSPGFVSNRILMPLINEAIEVANEGVASVQSIDEVFKSCFSHNMGPLETADLIGLDTILNSLLALNDSFGESKYKPCQLLVDMVNQGRLGRKSGQGFYNYEYNAGTNL